MTGLKGWKETGSEGRMVLVNTLTPRNSRAVLHIAPSDRLGQQLLHVQDTSAGCAQSPAVHNVACWMVCRETRTTARSPQGRKLVVNLCQTPWALFDMFLKVCKGSNCNQKRMQTDDTAAATHKQQSRLRCCFGLAVLIRRSSKSTI